MHQRLYILREQALERSELWMQMMSACQTYRDRSFTQAKEKEQIRQNQQRNQMLELNEHNQGKYYPEYLYADNAEELIQRNTIYSLMLWITLRQSS